MNIDLLTVYQCPFPKIRIGKQNDGGYVVADIPDIKYDLLLSGGIASDSSFEDRFIDYYEDCSGVGFDGTVKTFPYSPYMQFVKKNIGPVETGEETNLHSYLDQVTTRKIAVKMDIEGAELAWIESLKDEHIKGVEQIVIEFHENFWTPRGFACLEKLLRHHTLVHFHPNNAGDLFDFQGVRVIKVFELTLLNSKYMGSREAFVKSTDPVPSSIDQQNVFYRPDVAMNYPPFCNRGSSMET